MALVFRLGQLPGMASGPKFHVERYLETHTQMCEPPQDLNITRIF